MFIEELHRQRIRLKDVYEKDQCLFTSVQYQDVKKIRALRKRYAVRLKFNYASTNFLQLEFKLIVGLLLFILIPIIAQRYYWLVEVEAPKIEQKVKAEQFLEQLSLPIPKQNTAIIQQATDELSKKVEDISWVHVQQKGSTLIFSLQPAPYVNVNEQQNNQVLVAAKSGVIDRYFVASGQLLVKRGDSVKKGDVLVEDVLQQRASAKVYADYLLTVEFKLPANIQYKTDTEQKTIKLTEEHIDALILPLVERKILEQSAEDTTLSLQKLLHVTFDNDTVKGEVLYLVNENIAVPRSKRARR